MPISVTFFDPGGIKIERDNINTSAKVAKANKTVAKKSLTNFMPKILSVHSTEEFLDCKEKCNPKIG